MRVLIFANGILKYPKTTRDVIRPDDRIIAADGGARHCRSLGLIPELVIGDMDSLTAEEVVDFEEAGATIIRHPQDKDETDLELALLYAQKSGAKEVLLFGLGGERWDMTIANLLLLANPTFSGMRLRLLEGPQEITLVRGGDSLMLAGQPGDTISLIPIGGEARGVTLRGLKYSLEKGTLAFGSTLGISNVLEEAEAEIVIEEGALLCFIIHGKIERIEENEARR